MSFVTGGATKIFPLNWIKKCIEQYTKDHGKAPKVLVLATEDMIDYKLNSTIHQIGQLGIQFTHGDYLKPGEIDLAMEINYE